MLKVGELAKRTGLTVRTLHHYDAVGLLCPTARSATGYRLYDGADIKRLYHIVALVRLGFSLAQVAAMLSGAEHDISGLIEQQADILDEQISQATQLRERLLHLRQQFGRDDGDAMENCLKTLELMAIYDKYFLPEDIAQLRQRKLGMGEAGRDGQAEWRKLIVEVQQQMALKSAPESDVVQALRRRWQALIDLFTGNDPVLQRKVSEMYRKEESVKAHVGIDPAVWEFMRLAFAVQPAPALPEFSTIPE
jgi:DNA-binding transcriptional MerR regulator